MVEANDKQESRHGAIASAYRAVHSGLKNILHLVKSEVRLFYSN
jgi:hypothetical protein